MPFSDTFLWGAASAYHYAEIIRTNGADLK